MFKAEARQSSVTEKGTEEEQLQALEQEYKQLQQEDFMSMDREQGEVLLAQMQKILEESIELRTSIARAGSVEAGSQAESPESAKPEESVTVVESEGPTSEAIAEQEAADEEQRRGELDQAAELAERIRNGGESVPTAGAAGGVEGVETSAEMSEGYREVMRSVQDYVRNSGFEGTEGRLQNLASLLESKSLNAGEQEGLAQEVFDGMNHMNRRDADAKTNMILKMPDSPFRQKLKELENSRLESAGYAPIG